MARKFIVFCLVALVALLGLARSSSATTQTAAAAGPWVATDKADYAPGSVVHLTGGNWDPGEDVKIVTNDTLGNTWSQTDTVTADSTGVIVDDVPLPNYFVSDYTVTATAASGSATTTFTDAVNYQFLGADGLAHLTAGAEESLGSVSSGTNIAATCPNGLTAKGTGLGGGQSSSYAISYVSGYGDNATLSSPASRTQVNPAAGTFNGNGSTCTSLTISTGGLAAGTYHGELQMRNTGGATATTELYFFKLTVIPTQQPTSISAVSGSGTYGGSGSLTATLKSGSTALSGKTVGFTINGGSVGSAVTDATGVATLGGVSLSGIGAGTQTVAASFAGDSGFSSSSGSGNLAVAKAGQAITFTGAPFSAAYGSSFQVQAAASSGLAVGVVGTAGICNVTPDPLQPGAFNVNVLAGNGTCILTASQGGNTNYNAAADAIRNVAATKAAQTISFAAPPNKTYGDPDFSVSASSSSGLAVGFSAAGDCTISGASVHIVGAGSCTITAAQGGNANYDPAVGVARPFTIGKAAANVTVTCDAGPFTYNGAPYTPCSAIVTGAGGLGQSLSVGYSNNTGAGTATASATYAGDANHNSGVDSKTFAIDQAASTVALSCPDSRVYDGSAIEPCTAAATGVGGLDASVAVTYSGNVDAGTANAQATFDGDGNHTGSSASATFTIERAPSLVTVTCDAGPFVYNAAAQTPCSAKATGAGGLDADLTVTYSDNVDAGTATAAAAFDGDTNHTGGSDSTTFAIEKAPSTVAVTCPEKLTYTGGALTPCTAKVRGAGGLDSDLAVSYSDNVDAGTPTASAAYGGDANHHSSSGSATFTIEKAPSTVILTCATGPFVYDGSPQTPCSAKATGAGGLDANLPVSYSDNVGAGTATAAASYDGDANHTGNSNTATFEIEKAPSSVTLDCPDARTYTGDALEPCFAHATGAGSLDVSLPVSYTGNVNAGTATASASYDGDDNHLGNSSSGTFTIDKAPSAVDVSCATGPFVYDGSPHTPCSAKATGAGGLDVSLPVSYATNVDAGSATASASYAGDANHTGDSSSKAFTIDKAPSRVDVGCSDGPFVYSGSPYTPCSAHVSGAGGLDHTLPVDYAGNTDAGTATGSASYDGDANHTGDSDSATFTIEKASSLVTVSCPVSRTYTGSAIEPCTARATGPGGLDSAVPVSYAANVDAGTATASAAFGGDSNHLGSAGSATFTINKAASTVGVTCDPGPFTFNGSPQTPCSAGAKGAGGLDVNLPVSYGANVDAGTATASASYAGDANHLGDSSSASFTIRKATPTVNLTWTGWTYDGAAHPASGSVVGVGGAVLGSPAFTYYSGLSASGTPLAGAPSGVGAFTVLASYAGSANYTAASKTKTVTGLYRWDGFLQPINDTAHQGLYESSFKLGSTVPAKFQLKKANGTVVQAGALPVFSRSTTPVSCDTQIAAETLDSDVGTAGSTFRWDPTAQQYIYNWSTKGLKAGEYRIYATLDDGSKQYVDICLQ